jgi:hypothetical protein
MAAESMDATSTKPVANEPPDDGRVDALRCPGDGHRPCGAGLLKVHVRILARHHVDRPRTLRFSSTDETSTPRPCGAERQTRILCSTRTWLVELSALLDHPFDHRDDPTGPFWIRPDRRGLQREQARSVWSRPDRREAPGYGSDGWGLDDPTASVGTRLDRQSIPRGQARPDVQLTVAGNR